MLTVVEYTAIGIHVLFTDALYFYTLKNEKWLKVVNGYIPALQANLPVVYLGLGP